MRKQRRAAQSRGWLMNMWDKALGMCSSSSSSVPLQSHLVKQLKHRAGRVSFSTSSSVQGGFAGGGMVRVAAMLLPGGSPAVPWQLCWWQGAPPSCWPGAAFPAHLEAIWSWARAGAGAWLNRIEVEGCQWGTALLGSRRDSGPSEAALDTT